MDTRLSCYERAAPWRESRTASLLQGSGLVRTVGQCAQRGVASGHRDAFSME
jgi:hypothetical protein